MSIWAISDLHLSFGVPNKGMDIFGEHWKDWTDKIATQWKSHISPEDLVLIPGDISWAKQLQEAQIDLNWIDSLPGTKVLIRGNHDYWWHSLAQIKKILPSSCHLIQNSSFLWNNVAIAGARLWDVPGLDFQPYTASSDALTDCDKTDPMDKKIYERELQRLELSLKSIPHQATVRIVMTHYPPIGVHLEETEVSKLLEKYHVNMCVFGHLHNMRKEIPLFGKKNDITYYLTSCDYLPHFCPLKIL